MTRQNNTKTGDGNHDSTQEQPDKEKARKESEKLEALFEALEPDNRPEPATQRKRRWRSVDEYREARELKEQLSDITEDPDLDLDDS